MINISFLIELWSSRLSLCSLLPRFRLPPSPSTIRRSNKSLKPGKRIPRNWPTPSRISTSRRCKSSTHMLSPSWKLVRRQNVLLWNTTESIYALFKKKLELLGGQHTLLWAVIQHSDKDKLHLSIPAGMWKPSSISFQDPSTDAVAKPQPSSPSPTRTSPASPTTRATTLVVISEILSP